MGPSAGWYDDPTDPRRLRLRYWDGEQWTKRVREPDGEPAVESRDEPPQPSGGTPVAPKDDDITLGRNRTPSKRLLGAVVVVVVVLAAGVGGYLGTSSNGDSPVVDHETAASDEGATDEEAPETEETTSPTPSEPEPTEEPLLPAVRTGGVQPAADNVVTYREVEDLGFTASSLAAAAADIDSDLFLGWVVAPDRRRLCAVSTVGGPPESTVGPCHMPVLPDGDSDVCDDLRRLMVTFHHGDEARLAGTAEILSGQVEDPVLADRLAETAGMLPTSEAPDLEYAALTFELADLYCGALQRTSARVPDTLDADGAEYDLGEIVSTAPQPDGTVVIEFDRFGYAQPGDGYVDGPDIDQFPLIYNNTDVPWNNLNPQLRSFVVAETALFYTMDPYGGLCNEPNQPPPTWSVTTLDELVSYQGNPAAMRYDDNGLVVEIGRGAGC